MPTGRQVWQALPGFTPSGVQASFMKYTAQQIKRSLIKNKPDMLETFKVNKYDREYQIWKRESLGIELLNESHLPGGCPHPTFHQ